MTISLFNLFSIGIGPSSSHTVGPMRAAHEFVEHLVTTQVFESTVRIQVDLFGSLALTGVGHGTDKAILNGLSGYLPESVDPLSVEPRKKQIIESKQLLLRNTKEIHYDHARDFIFHQRDTLPFHSNGMRFSAYDSADKTLSDQVYYSIGGGFIVEESSLSKQITQGDIAQPYPFSTAKELLAHCEKNKLTIAQLMMENEKVWRTENEIKQGVLNIIHIMDECIAAGCVHEGELPGGLHVKRRAPGLYQKLQAQRKPEPDAQADMMNWLNLYAMAVNEENAAGGRVVTAPTNGAAGIVPAVLKYYREYHRGVSDEKLIEFILTAGAIAILYKKGASISGAEVGCQGEVGVACSMAAGALSAVLDGTLAQVENAAEIAMEHHLGMTCDPVGGLVQIPCIERNAMGAVKAVNAARLALMESGEHKVSLDKVIQTMKNTGRDMMTIYKETSQGGLAVNLPEC